MLTFTLPLIAIPIALVIAARALIRKRGDPATVRRRSFRLYLWTAIGLFAAPLFINWPSSLPGLGYGLALALAPAAVGVIAMALLHLGEWYALNRREKIVIGSAVLLLVVAQIWIGSWQADWQWSQTIFLDLAVLTISVLLFMVWKIGSRYPLLVGCTALLYMLSFNILEGGALPLLDDTSGTWFSVVSTALYLLLPGFVITTAAMLTLHALEPSPSSDEPGFLSQRAGIGRWALVVALLGSLIYTIVWLCIWDGTDDGIRGIIILMLSTLTAAAAGMVMGLTSAGWHRWSGLAFAVLVAGLVYWTIMVPGNRFRPYDITEARAGRIQQAIENYHAETSWYPLELDELVPGELLRIPLPMIIPRQDWCYEGGSNYYRLGAIYRDHWSSPHLSVRVYASAGSPPETPGACAEKLAELLAHNELQLKTAPTSTPLPTSVVSSERTVVEPVFQADSLSVGDWSPDGRYLVFGPTEYTAELEEQVEIDLQFLDAQTGEVCEAAANKWKAGERSDGLHEHYAWLPEGRFLYVSEAGEMVTFKPCADTVEDLAGRYPVKFTQAASFDRTGGRILLRNQDGYWLLNGSTLEVQQIPDLHPNLAENQSDRFAWLPGGDRLAISQLNGEEASEGVTIFIVDGASAQVQMSLPLGRPEEVDAPFVDWLTRDEILVQLGDSLLVMDLRSDPPKTTDLIRDVFLLDLSYPIDFSSMDFVRNPDGDGYYIGVQVNHPHNQDAYVYDSETGQVRVFQHDTHTLLFFPDGQCMRLLKWEDTPTYRDEYEMVWIDRPSEEHRLVVEGHVPRSHPQMFPRCLPGSAQLVFNSSQGISLISLPDGKTVHFWELAEGASSSHVLPSPLGEALVVTADGGGLYYIPLPAH